MKKSALVLSGLFFAFLCSVCFAALAFANEPVNPNRFERLVKSPHLKAKSLSESPEPENPETGEIHNVVSAAVLDTDLDKYCIAYEQNIEVSVPDEGLTFYLIYYHRAKNKDGTWSEWVKDFTGNVWHFTPQEAEEEYLWYYSYLAEELESIPPSRWQFMVEMYDPFENLLDTFEVSRYRYWYPMVESDGYDVKTP